MATRKAKAAPPHAPQQNAPTSSSSSSKASSSFIVLLRGVNVGGHRKLPMAELKDTLTGLGYANVRTLLASGNVVVDVAAASCAALEQRLEGELQQHMGLTTDVLVRDPAEWTAIVAANPLLSESKADPSHTLMMALKAPPSSSSLATIKAWQGPERIVVHGREVYIFFGAGMADSKLNLTKLGVGTGRNWNTVLKLQALVAG